MASVIFDSFDGAAGSQLKNHVTDSGHHWNTDASAGNGYLLDGAGGVYGSDFFVFQTVVDAASPSGYAEITFTPATEFTWQVGVGAFTGTNMAGGTSTCDLVVLHCAMGSGTYQLRHHTTPSTFTVIATLPAQGGGTLRIQGGDAILNGVVYPGVCALTGDKVAIYTVSSTGTASHKAKITSLDAGTITIPPAWQDLEGVLEASTPAHQLSKYGLAIPFSGSPGSPAADAYLSYEPAVVCQIFIDGASYGWVFPKDSNEAQFTLLSAGLTPDIASYRCLPTLKPVYHPAATGTDGTTSALAEWTTLANNLGWNAGARSIAVLRGDGSVSFKVVSAVGVAAGLNTVDAGQGYTELSHGFMLSDGLVTIIESGAQVVTVGPFVAGDAFKIVRLSGVVSYYQNDALLYTSTRPSSGTVFLDTSLYSAGDAIDTPAFGAIAGANLRLPALGAFGGRALAQARIKLPALSVSSRWAQGGALTLPALAAFGGRRTSSARLQLPALSVHGDAGHVLPRFAIGAAQLPRLKISGHGLTGRLAHGNLSLRAPIAIGADRIYGAARLTLPRLRAGGSAFEGRLNATLASLATGRASMTGSAQLAVLMHSSGQLGAVMAYSCVIGAGMDDGAHAEDSMGAQAVLQALMLDGAVARVTGAGEEPRTSDWEVWSMDWDSGDSTAYEGFEFNSFAKVGGRHFGAMRGGIYLLEGDDDAGAPIRASVHFGAHDFGESVHKRVPNVYAGVSASGQLLLRVSVDGGSDYLYAARGVDVARKVTRFDLGRGLRGTYYVFELFNQDGADFDLDAIEFLPVALTRRI